MKKLNKLLISLLAVASVMFENCIARPFVPGIELLPTKNLYISYIFDWLIILGIGIFIWCNFRTDKLKNFKVISLAAIIFALIGIIGLVRSSFMSKNNEYFYYSKGLPVMDIPILGEYTYVFLISGFILIFNIMLIVLLGKKSNVKRTILAFILPIYILALYLEISICFLGIFEGHIDLLHLIYCASVLLNFISIVGGIRYILGKSKDDEIDRIESKKNMKVIIFGIIVLLFFSGLLIISEPQYQSTLFIENIEKIV